MNALGLIEIPFLSITALGADAVLKTARVCLLGFETTGTRNLMIKLVGDAAAETRSLSS